ncbi:ESCRT-II complex, vps25 subunit, partial [Caulochytrium protostelioides]
PEIHSFPPFFTLQPNEATQKKQTEMWIQLILDYARAHRLFQLNLQRPHEPAALFTNTKLQRAITQEHLATILDAMAAQERGQWLQSKAGGATAATAGTTVKDKGPFLVHWRTPAEWGDLLHRWADETGQLGAVCTVFEVLHGSLSEGQAFHELPEIVALLAFENLVKRGRAQLFSGSSPSAGLMERGIKFLASP